MVTDKNGKELKAGDEIVVRGKIVAVLADFEKDGQGIVQVEWQENAVPVIYLFPQTIEKAD